MCVIKVTKSSTSYVNQWLISKVNLNNFVSFFKRDSIHDDLSKARFGKHTHPHTMCFWKATHTKVFFQIHLCVWKFFVLKNTLVIFFLNFKLHTHKKLTHLCVEKNGTLASGKYQTHTVRVWKLFCCFVSLFVVKIIFFWFQIFFGK